MARVAGQRRQRDLMGAALRAQAAALVDHVNEGTVDLVDTVALQRLVEEQAGMGSYQLGVERAELQRQYALTLINQLATEPPSREDIVATLLAEAEVVAKPKQAWTVVAEALNWMEELTEEDIVTVAFACLAALSIKDEPEAQPSDEPVIEGLAPDLITDELVPVRVTGAAASALLQKVGNLTEGLSVAEEPEPPRKRPVKKVSPPRARPPRGRIDLNAVADDNPFANGALPGVQLAGPLKKSPPRKASGHNVRVQQWKRDGSGRRVPIDQED